MSLDAQVLTVSVPEGARLLGMGVDHTYGLVKAGRLKVIRTGAKGRRWRIPVAELEAFIERESK
jgi:excisionase family DNA binding protein